MGANHHIPKASDWKIHDAAANMSEHTPTPWRFSPSHVEEGPSAVRTGQTYPEDYIVCTTASDADAELIVKAVNAHDALVETLRLAQGYISYDTDIPKADELLNKIGAVLDDVSGLGSDANG